MVIATRHTPKSVVSFTTEQGEIILREDVDKQGSVIDRDVLNISTMNDLNADAGTFQITLSDKNRWDLVLASNDFVRIQMYRDDDGKDMKQATVMMGLVDDVRRVTKIQNNNPQRQCVITGRNFAKALINFEVGVVQEVSMTTSSIGWTMGRVTFAGSSAADVIQQIFDNLIHEYMDYTFKNGQSFKSYSNLKLSSRPGEQLFDEKSFINYQGSMHSFIKEVSNEPFNQLFWECYDDGLATLVLRETPFNPNNWNTLPTHIIYDEDVLDDSIGRSDVETYSLFSVGMQNYFSSADTNMTLGVFPYWSEKHFKKYGLRRLHRFTGYVGYANTTDQATADGQIKEYQRDLFNWNINNPDFYNGTIVVQGRNHYKVGDKLLYLSRENGMELEFFIESVSHSFENYSTWTTTLSVTRGMPAGGEGRFEDPWDTFEEYTGGALGEPAAGDIQSTGVATDGSMSFSPIVTPGSGSAASVVQIAQQIGQMPTKYVWGGGRTEAQRNKGWFDCSSYVHHVFKLAGISLGGYGYPAPTTQEFAKIGTPVNLQSALPGDIIFFDTNRKNGHIGIYLGNGQWIGCQGSTGVAIESVTGSYWGSKFRGHIRRVL